MSSQQIAVAASPPAPVSQDAGISQPPHEILTFTLAGEDYGVDILQVQEIRGYTGVTRLPDTPDWIKGVINLRGVIVPVLDLRLKLARGEARYDATTVMIIVMVEGRVVGLVVDAVSDVTELASQMLRPTPALGGAVDQRMIRGIATVGKRMIILFDVAALLRDGLPAGPALPPASVAIAA